MTSFCTIHQIEMTKRESKTKFDAEGNPITYFAHTNGTTLCFGEGLGKAERKGNLEGYKNFQAAGAALKNEPMTTKDRNFKEFTKGLGVFSAAARKEGMDPVSAFRDMHIAQWLRVAYGDTEGYGEWIEGVKNRLKELTNE